MTTPSAPDTSEPAGLMWACLTASGTAAAETAVCSQHLTGYTPTPWPDPADPVRALTLHDVTGNDALTCTVCEATAEDVAYLRDRGSNVRPTTTVVLTVPATIVVTVEVDGDASRYYVGAHRAEITDAAVRFVPDVPASLVEAVGPASALGAVDAAEVLRLARAEVDGAGIFPAPHWH